MENTLKYDLFEQLALVSKALGHANRLMILDVLAQTHSDVDTLRQKTGLSLANVSKHLQALKQAGLVKNSRDGQRIIYALSDLSVLDAIASLRKVAEGQLESMQDLLHQHLQPNTPLEPISLSELKALKTPYTLLDVRPADEFAAGHLPNAINMPMENLTNDLNQLPTKAPLIVYCRGPYCVWSSEAVTLLHAQGLQASRLAQGYPEWVNEQSDA